MNLKLFMARWFIPQSFKRAEINNLFSATAQAFGEDGPRGLESETLEAVLAGYATFTRKHAERIILEGKSLDVVHKDLFNSSFAIGARLRKELGIQSFSDVRIAARAIYRSLKIDFRCGRNGEVTIKKCFFSSHYSAAVCALVSSLDSGLIAGLSGGNTMAFYERITAHDKCCRARITM